ncbi:MAG: type I phosphomannose isomerase catalytic subunit [Planctomycetota bacterium]
MPDQDAAQKAIGLLRFRPILKEKIWGGRRLAEVFGRELPAPRIGESWEVSGLREALTPVAAGPFMGADLYRLAAARGEEVFGSELAPGCRADFPLLVKFIDASDVLSVQVHPGDDYARAQGFPNGKSEAWVVVAADEGAFVYRGFADGVGPDEFRAALDSGSAARVGECLRKVTVKAGDVIDLPAGTVHAIGKGLLLYEVQQSSDATYRVYDWGRVGLDGGPRPLHLDKAWDVMEFGGTGPDTLAGVEAPQGGGGGASGAANMKRRVCRDSAPFHLEVARATAPARIESPHGQFEIVSVLSGRAEFTSPAGETARLGPGDSALVPASWDGYGVSCGEPVEWVRTWVV